MCSRRATASVSLSSLIRRVGSMPVASQMALAEEWPIPVIYVRAIGTRLAVGRFTPAIRATCHILSLRFRNSRTFFHNVGPRRMLRAAAEFQVIDSQSGAPIGNHLL